MSASINDRRRAPRTPITVEVSYESSVNTGGAEAVDVSETGLFLSTSNPLPVGTRLELNFDDVAFKVRVARVVEAGTGSDRPSGMGVAIVEADDEARSAMARHLARSSGGASASVRVDSPWDDPISARARSAPDGSEGVARAEMTTEEASPDEGASAETEGEASTQGAEETSAGDEEEEEDPDPPTDSADAESSSRKRRRRRRRR